MYVDIEVNILFMKVENWDLRNKEIEKGILGREKSALWPYTASKKCIYLSKEIWRILAIFQWI